LRKVHLCR